MDALGAGVVVEAPRLEPERRDTCRKEMTPMSHVPIGTAGGGGPLTRRRFIQAVGAVGGTAAAWSAMTAWGHLAEAKQTAPPTLPGESGGASVIILGAGPAGLVAGYELGKK